MTNRLTEVWADADAARENSEQSRKLSEMSIRDN